MGAIQNDPLYSTNREAHDTGGALHQLSFPEPFLPAGVRVCFVVKRDGRKAPFEMRKIAESILRASQSVEGEDRVGSEGVAAAVSLYLRNAAQGGEVSVEHVQAAVERVLVELGHARTALAYATYREKRARFRRLLQPDITQDVRRLAGANVEEEAAPAEPDWFRAQGLLIRTSDERLVEWNPERITEALVRETGMARDQASRVAADVERQIQAAGVQTLTAPLVRELVDARLIELGLEEYRRRHARLGLPLFDAERILCVPNHGDREGIHDPAATDLALADRVKREYALTRVFSQEVADAHLMGDIHIHDLGAIDRLRAGTHSIENLSRFGGLAGASCRAPRNVESFVTQWALLHDTLQRHFSGLVAWDAVNCHLAPFLAEADDQELRRIARMTLFAFTARAALSSRPIPRPELSLCWDMPDRIQGTEVTGPDGEPTGHTYGDYAATAQRFAWALLEAYLDVDSARDAMPVPCVHITQRLLARPGHGMFLALVDQVAAAGAPILAQFDRAATEADGTECIHEAPPGVTLHSVTLNLPRAAFRARREAPLAPEQGLLAELDRLVKLACDAHSQKADFIWRLFTFGDLGPFSRLKCGVEGSPYVDIEGAICCVGVLGLEECVRVLTGGAPCEDGAGFALAGRILEHLGQLCRAGGARTGLRLVPAHTLDTRAAIRLATLDLHAFPELARPAVSCDPLTHDFRYTLGGRCNASAAMTPLERIAREGRLHQVMSVGAISEATVAEAESQSEGVAPFLQEVFYRTACRRLLFHSRA